MKSKMVIRKSLEALHTHTHTHTHTGYNLKDNKRDNIRTEETYMLF